MATTSSRTLFPTLRPVRAQNLSLVRGNPSLVRGTTRPAPKAPKPPRPPANGGAAVRAVDAVAADVARARAR